MYVFIPRIVIFISRTGHYLICVYFTSLAHMPLNDNGDPGDWFFWGNESLFRRGKGIYSCNCSFL